ncbi:hypothetical protein ES703_74029 [subsurface metagenome]
MGELGYLLGHPCYPKLFERDFDQAVGFTNRVYTGWFSLCGGQVPISEYAVWSYHFNAGDYVVSLAQPNGALVKSLLAEAHYPDNAITRRADGSILRPYDMANFVLAEHMGVHVFPANQKINVELELLTSGISLISALMSML